MKTDGACILAAFGALAVAVMLATALWHVVLRPCVTGMRMRACGLCRSSVMTWLLPVLLSGALIHYAGAKSGAVNGVGNAPQSASRRSGEQTSLEDGNIGPDIALHVDSLTFTSDSVVLPVSWTPGLLASGSVLSVWGTDASLTNEFREMRSFAVQADGQTNAVLSAPFTNALHSQAFFSVRSNADADCDGLCDYVESVVFHSDPHSPDTNGDGFTDLAKYRLGLDPANSPSAVLEHSPSLFSIAVCGAFDLCSTNGLSGAFYSRTFQVGRDTPYRQFFLSSSPTGAGHVAFGGLRIDYRDSSGFRGSVGSASSDGIRLQLSTNAIESITVEMHATGPWPWMGAPLHLVGYEPDVVLSGLSGTCDVGEGERADLLVGKQAVGVATDWAGRPSLSELSQEEVDILDFFPGEDGVRIVDMNANTRSGGASPGIAFPGPGLYGLPGGHRVFVLLPSVSYGSGHCYAGSVLEWTEGSVEEKSSYPLDSKCLWDGWIRGDETAYGCSCEPALYAGADTDLYSFVTTSQATSGESITGHVYVNGVEVWHGTAVHDVRARGTDSDALEDGCCVGGCEDGGCDDFEGDGIGSVRFRIPLGLTARERIAGFLYFDRDEPFPVSRESFSLLSRPDAAVSDSTACGVRSVVCSDSRGRTLCVSNIASGVGIAIADTQTGEPVHSWEITNPSSASMRFRKISKRGNVMSDRTYACANGVWTRSDAISGEETTVLKTGDLYTGEKRQERVVRCGGTVSEHVVTEHSLIGWEENAVLRETYRAELGADGTWKESFANYWDDWESPARHGQLRFAWGDDRQWRYADYDETGRETLRIEQRDGSDAPNEWEFWTADHLPGEAAFVTTSGYAALPGDSDDPRDRERPRVESRYVSENGEKTLVGRTWRRYVRGMAGGYPTVSVTTIRACSPAAAPDDAGNAVSSETRFAEDSGSVPLVMRGAIVESLGDDGVATANSYSLADGVLSSVSQKSYQSRPFPTYDTADVDATYGTVLRRTTRLAQDGTVIADQSMAYDDQNRLRSTTYLDGTWETNAYSCCRLLWSRDRTGARTLRSAVTGTDRLYYAEERVGVLDLPRTPVNRDYHYDSQWTANQFERTYPVVQHFFDSLGRETNTVHRSASTEGEAESPSFPHRGGYVTSETRRYPQGVSDVEERIDGRGLRTVRFVRHTQAGEETVEEEWEPGEPSPSVVATNLQVRGGGSVSWRSVMGRTGSGAPKWTCSSRFSAYPPDGRRIDYDISESSDCGVVTNSVTVYDFLGRVARRTTPTSSVEFEYDGATPRVASSFDAVSGVAATNVYDECGELAGTLSGGETSERRVSYAFLSNAWWRVETERRTGCGATNSVAETRTRLTGLSDGLRTEVVELAEGAEVSRTTTAWDANAGAVTQCVWSAASGLSWAKFVHGSEVESVSPRGRIETYYSPLGLPYFWMRSALDGGSMRRWRLELADGCGDVVLSGAYHTNKLSSLQTAYSGRDCRGNVVEREDEAGNVVTNAVDAEGNIVASGGATYPMEASYDSQGRRVSLATFRAGESGDVTQWAYDAATGACINKTYADCSTVSYTHTPDGLPLRTTCASGRWKESAYDSRRHLVGVSHSDSSLDFSIRRDVFGRATNVTDAAGGEWRYGYGFGDTVLREVMRAGHGATQTAIVRTFDSVARQTGYALSVDGSAKGGAGYAYGGDGLLACVAATNSAGRVFAVAYSNIAARCCGYVVSTPAGASIRRIAVRDNFRRDLVNNCSTSFNGDILDSHTYTYDVLSRPTSRNADAFAYNERSEIVSASIGTNLFAHAYDCIGNQTTFAANAATNTFTHNALNQITSSLCDSAALCEISHDLDGNMINDCVFTYSYDAANRLASVSSNGVVLVANQYDYRGRRTRKTTPAAETTFVYDGWNLILETVSTVSGTTTNTTEIQYFWGMDLSESLQGAGCVGGLLAVSVNGQFYFPAYDNNGNVTKYIDESGNVVAAYIYNAFGKTISQTGPMAGFFRHRFSTKYYDTETGLYYYGYRFYSPSLMRWLNRDPIEEDGGLNLYGFCGNDTISRFDGFGRNVTLTTGNRNTSWWQIGNRFLHQEICVDTWSWNKKSCCWRQVGRSCFSFMAIGLGFGRPSGSWLGMSSVKGPGILRGEVYSTEDQGLEDTETLETTVCQDMAFLAYLISLDGRKDTYSVARHNCRTFSQAMLEEAKRRSGANNRGCKNGKKCE